MGTILVQYWGCGKAIFGCTHFECYSSYERTGKFVKRKCLLVVGAALIYILNSTKAPLLIHNFPKFRIIQQCEYSDCRSLFSQTLALIIWRIYFGKNPCLKSLKMEEKLFVTPLQKIFMHRMITGIIQYFSHNEL